TGRERIALHEQAGEFAVDVPTGGGAFDDFLSEVTAFPEANRLLQADLKHNPPFVHIDTVPGNPRFDPQCVKGDQADGAQPQWRPNLEQRLPHRFGLSSRHKDFIAVLTGVAGADEADGDSGKSRLDVLKHVTRSGGNTGGR